MKEYGVKMKLLFVVHRYIPFPGGSEFYTAAMAEEALSRGHTVTVLTGEHCGDQNGIHVTSDTNILLQNWDLIIVHGFGPAVQNFILHNIKNIPNPVLYMIILPSEDIRAIKAMQDCDLIGYSTLDDINHIKKYGLYDKSVQIRHGIKFNDSIGSPGFKKKYNIPSDRKMFLSVGGYWPNKKHRELANLFINTNIENSILVTTGYDNRHDLMPLPVHNKVIPLMIEDKSDVINAISEADCYLMHSTEEGFGLVILESMLNKTPWISRNIAGAAMLKKYGFTYDNDQELINLLRNFDQLESESDLDESYDYVINNHLIKHTVDDIENAVKQIK